MTLSTVVEHLIANAAEPIRAVLDGTGPAHLDLAGGVTAHRRATGPCRIGDRWYGSLTAGGTSAVLRVDPDGAVAVGTLGETAFEPYQAIRRLCDSAGVPADGPARLALLTELYRNTGQAKEPEYATVSSCPCCSTDPQQALGLARCTSCGTWYRAGVSDAEWAGVYGDESGAYFRGLDADQHTGTVGPHGYEDYTEWSDVILGPGHFDRRVQLVETVTGRRSGRALDVGCATGAMVAAMARRGWTAHGIDLSPYCVRTAAERHREGTFTVGTVSDVDGMVDLVSYLDVFEHLSDPRAELTAVHGILAEGGALLLELPNQASADAEVLGTDYLFGEHLFFHVPTGIRLLLESCGFAVLSVHTEHDTYFRVQDVVGEPYATELAAAGRGERLLVVARKH